MALQASDPWLSSHRSCLARLPTGSGRVFAWRGVVRVTSTPGLTRGYTVPSPALGGRAWLAASAELNDAEVAS